MNSLFRTVERAKVVGLLADFLVATPEDAQQYTSLARAEKPTPIGRIERAEYKNFTPLTIEVLWAILREDKWEARRHGLEHISQTKNTWLMRFPNELVQLISALDDVTANRVAVAWAQDQEVRGSSNDLLPILRKLQHLAVQAQTSGRSLYLWVSL